MLRNAYLDELQSNGVLKEIRFTYRHAGCWLQDATSNHDGLTLVATSLYLSGPDVVMDLTAHAPKAATIGAAISDWDANPRISRIVPIHEGPRGTRLQVTYEAAGSIYPHIIEHTPISLGPIQFMGGVEHYQIIGVTADLSKLMGDLSLHGDLEVQSVRDAGAPEPQDGTAWQGLTDKQRGVLIAAHKDQYYQWPRGSSASAIADRLGLSSSAFLDHLRTAEATIISAEVQRAQAATTRRA